MQNHYALDALEQRVMLSVSPVVGNLPENNGSNPIHPFGSATDLYYMIQAPTQAIVHSDGAGGVTPILNLLAGSTFYGGTMFGNTAYISLLAGSNSQLWVSDGTAANTVKILEFPSGSPAPQSLNNLNGTLVFTQGSSVWRSDGTQAGTVKLSNPAIGTPVNPTALFNLNGTLYFGANGGLWKTDGTDAGTTIVSSAPSTLSWFAQLNGKLFFSANSQSGYELWISDGTAAGTMVLKDIYPGSQSSFPSQMTNVNGTLYFNATLPGVGTELWKSDGTSAGTVLVADIDPGSDSSNPTEFKNLNGKVSFMATGASDSGGTAGLYVTDGTPGGTQRLLTINPAADYDVAGGLAYFNETDPIAGQELGASDGTIAGTRLVADINPGPAAAAVNELQAVGGKIYFSATDGLHGQELWTSDGTPAGTAMVADADTDPVNTGATRPIPLNGRTIYSDSGGTWALDADGATPVRLTGAIAAETAVSGPYLYLSVANNGNTPSSIWRTDGTPGGTTLLDTFTSDSTPRHLFPFGSGILFSAKAPGASDYALWSSDGTPAGTLPLPANNGSPAFDPQSFAQAGSTVYFYAYDSLTTGGHGYEPWKTDGTPAGTMMVKDVVPGPGSSAFNGAPAGAIAAFGTSAVFTAATPSGGGEELWTTDGTDAGTVQVTNFSATGGALQIDPSGYPSIVEFTGIYYFFEHESGHHTLWRSDGTPTGTHIVQFVDGDPDHPIDITNAGSQLFFVDVRGATPTEYDLWRSDGTAAGTVQLKSFPVDSSLFLPGIGPITSVNGTAYFSAWSVGNGTGNELWQSDGTAAGTVLAADVVPGPANSNPAHISDGGNGTVLFSAAQQPGAGGIYRFTPDTPSATTFLTRDPDNLHIDWSRGSFKGQILLNDPAGLTLNGNGSNDTIILNYTNGNPLPANLHLNGTFTLNYLQGPNPFAGTTLDLNRSTLFITYSPGSSPLSSIQQALKSGYDSGSWTGSSPNGVITSSAAVNNPAHNTAIGYADSATDPAINTTPNSIELKYTLNGDTNLNGTVDIFDLNAMLPNFNKPGSWTTGDFNYTGTVDIFDLNAMLPNFNQA
jgi:ELWxxDGT repeat protein